MQEMQVQFLGWEDPLEKGMPSHSSILAWEIPWTEEPDRLQSMGWKRTGHYWMTEHRHSTHRKKHSKENEESWVLKLELNKVSQPLNLPEPSFLFRKGDTWTSTPRFSGIFQSKGSCIKSTKSFLQHFVFMCSTGNGLNMPACKPGAWSLLNCIHSDGSNLQLDCTVHK